MALRGASGRLRRTTRGARNRSRPASGSDVELGARLASRCLPIEFKRAMEAARQATLPLVTHRHVSSAGPSKRAAVSVRNPGHPPPRADPPLMMDRSKLQHWQAARGVHVQAVCRPMGESLHGNRVGLPVLVVWGLH